jgi:hypothetical protein
MLAAVAALLLVLPAASAFAAEELHVTIAGHGSGEVTSGNEGEFEGNPAIACSYDGKNQSGICDNKFAYKGGAEEFPGAGVTLLDAKASPGSKFIEWTREGGQEFQGCGTEPKACMFFVELGNEEEVKMKALFCLVGESQAACEAEPNVKVTIETGSGSVVSNPAGLECSGEAVKSCEAALPEGPVVLTASPAPGYAFKSWKKCDTGGVNGRQCTIKAEKGKFKEIGVSFIKVWNLKGTKSGGLGILGSSPGGVNCGYACTTSTAFYKEGSLTVKAKPAKNFHFVEFSGGTGSASSCTGVTAETCTFTIAADSTVNEVYAENAKNTLTLTKEGGGQGFVKTKPTNINCGLTCTAAKAEFFASESPEVTVTLGKGTTKVTWTTGAGTCTGNALTCAVPMSSSKTLVAKFD